MNKRFLATVLAAVVGLSAIALPVTVFPIDIVRADEAESKKVAVESFVQRFYTLCLERTADATGLSDWSTRLMSGAETGADVAFGFTNSQEFLNRAVTNGQYITILYEAFFGREADPTGMQAWQSALDSGLSRLYVLKGFTDSQEFSALCAGYGITQGSLVMTEPYDMYPDIARFVIRFYRSCLGREADPSGLNDWILRLVSKQSKGVDIARGFIFSNEFLSKNLSDEDFVAVLYRAFFDRVPDPTGTATWLGQLQNGYERISILAGFVNSSEFSALAARYGIETGYLDPMVVSSDPNAPLISYCRSFLGVPYKYSGSTPQTGFDCSGFVCYIYKTKYNITLPHGSYYICKIGTEVAGDAIQPGDVLCYDYLHDGIMDHVALYVGFGRMIHASTSRHGIVEDPVDTAGTVTIRRFL